MAHPVIDTERREATVISRHPVRRFFVVLLVLGAAIGLGFWAGVQHGADNEHARWADVEIERDRLAGSLAALQKQYRQSRQQRVSLERGRAIDAQALNQAQQSIVELETRNAALRSDLAFYKNIMAPASIAKGLQIDRLNLSENPDGSFEFRLALTQAGNNQRYQLGLVTISFIGQIDGSARVLALHELSPQFNDTGVKFRFRYFQNVKGTLTLPERFEPLEVVVAARPGSGDAGKVERTFSWNALTSR